MNKPPRWHKDAPAPKRPDRPLWASPAPAADRHDSDPRDPNSVSALPIYGQYKPPSRAPAKPAKHKRRAAYHEAPDAGLKRFLKCK